MFLTLKDSITQKGQKDMLMTTPVRRAWLEKMKCMDFDCIQKNKICQAVNKVCVAGWFIFSISNMYFHGYIIQTEYPISKVNKRWSWISNSGQRGIPFCLSGICYCPICDHSHNIGAKTWKQDWSILSYNISCEVSCNINTVLTRNYAPPFCRLGLAKSMGGGLQFNTGN